MLYIQNDRYFRTLDQSDATSAFNGLDPVRATITETRDAGYATNTSYRIAVGDTFRGNLDSGSDRDSVAVRLTTGEAYRIDLKGTDSGVGTLPDPLVRIYQADGTLLDLNDDGGTGRESSLTFTPTTTGVYYLAAGSYADSSSGTYAMSVKKDVPPSLDELGNYLTHGYWRDNGESWRAFDNSDNNRITADISGLTAAGKQLARWAMQAWEMVADIDFRIVNSPNADITFDDRDNNAYSTSSVTGHTINSSYVNVGLNWLNTYGTTLDSYSFQTYIHELGHALGLGHMGNYNGSATYGVDHTFTNDSWQVSIMSYFTQTENPTVDADLATLLTTMVADNVAIQNLYGVAGTSSETAGNTTWGLGTNLTNYMKHLADHLAGNSKYFSGYLPTALTISDRGGVDTLNLSFATAKSSISLHQGEFSNVNGVIGNLGIARGTVIENLITGSGNDEIIGNRAHNIIRSGQGNDKIFGGDGKDTLNGGGGNDQIAGQVGADRLVGASGNDTLSGGNGNDTLLGEGGNDRLNGGTGHDRLLGHDGRDTLVGGEGNDMLYGQAGHDRINGGVGNDVAYGGIGKDTISGQGGHDKLVGAGGNDKIYGHSGNDSLLGGGGNDLLSGLGGNDRLVGDGGNDRLIGGVGNDTLIGGGGLDTFQFFNGDGHDVIRGFNKHNGEKIDLRGVDAIESFGDMINHHLQNQNGDAKIVYFTGSILLEGVAFRDVGNGRSYDADDFIF